MKRTTQIEASPRWRDRERQRQPGQLCEPIRAETMLDISRSTGGFRKSACQFGIAKRRSGRLAIAGEEK